VNSGEIPIKFGDSWFSAKAILVVRYKKFRKVEHFFIKGVFVLI